MHACYGVISIRHIPNVLDFQGISFFENIFGAFFLFGGAHCWYFSRFWVFYVASYKYKWLSKPSGLLAVSASTTPAKHEKNDTNWHMVLVLMNTQPKPLMACICQTKTEKKKKTEINNRGNSANRCRFHWWKTFIFHVIRRTPNMENQFFKITRNEKKNNNKARRKCVAS